MPEAQGLLETRSVFIDTQVFCGLKLDFDHRALKQFIKLCQSHELISYTSDIVIRETKRKLIQQIDNAVALHEKFKRDAVNIRGKSLEGIDELFVTIDADAAKDKALETFDMFLEETNTTVLHANKVNIDEVFDLYFNLEPPFGPNGKTKEFPDAFTLLAITDKFPHEKIYVVSGDGDLKKYCETTENLCYETKLNTVIDHCLAHKTALVSIVKEKFELHRERIIERFTQELIECETINVSDWEDSEVDIFEVKELEFHNISVVDIDDNEAVFNFDVVVKYNALVSGPDFSNAVYDSEDGRYIILDSSTAKESGELSFEAEVEMRYYVDRGELVVEDVYEALPNLNGLIEISVGNY